MPNSDWNLAPLKPKEDVFKFKDMLPWKPTQRQPGTVAETNPFETVHKEFERVFDRLGKVLFSWLDPQLKPEHFHPCLHIKETKSGFVLNMELPGLNSEDLEIQIDGDHLIIKGEKESQTNEEDDTWHKQELTYSSFNRSLLLPPKADSDQTEADLKTGFSRFLCPNSGELLVNLKLFPSQLKPRGN